MTQDVSRRALLKGGGAALAGLSALQVSGPAHAFPGHGDEQVLPWLGQPPEPPFPDPRFVKWEGVDWFFPAPEKFMIFSPYFTPAVDPTTFRLGIGGLVARPY